MSFHHRSVTWRFPMALLGLLSIIIMITIPLMPESPRWLVKKGQVDYAKQVLANLTAANITLVKVQEAVTKIESFLALAGEARVMDIFTNGPLRLFYRRSLVCIAQCF